MIGFGLQEFLIIWDKSPEIIILLGLALAMGIWIIIDPGPDHRNPWDF
jgi:hypothetical protein|tara:strand:+ start:615 stop:758 length:144 start_codon:yes stop_codon:yes gene_type:complete